MPPDDPNPAGSGVPPAPETSATGSAARSGPPPTPASTATGATARSGSTRRAPQLLLIIAAALLLARIAVGIYENFNPPEVADRIRWRAIGTEVDEAQATGKPILYDFTADWCAPCQLMRREVFADRKSAESIEKLFIPVKVLDRSREEGQNPPAVTLLQEHFRIDGFPTLVVVSPRGGEPVMFTGYPGREHTLQQLKEANMRIRLAMFGKGLIPDSLAIGGGRKR